MNLYQDGVLVEGLRKPMRFTALESDTVYTFKLETETSKLSETIEVHTAPSGPIGPEEP